MPRGPSVFEHAIFVCTGRDCRKCGAKQIAKSLEREIRERGLKKKARVFRTKCTDYCKLAPIVAIQPQGRWLTGGTPEDAIRETLAIVAPDEER